MQGFFKLTPNNALPSPADGDSSLPWWWDHLASQANELRQVGFTAVWLPPVLKAAAGPGPVADDVAFGCELAPINGRSPGFVSGNLTAAAPVWARNQRGYRTEPSDTETSPMRFPRRQHNATILPDGTVLVTGGTQGNGFNNLDPGQPVHAAELWDPATGNWTVLAAVSP